MSKCFFDDPLCGGCDLESIRNNTQPLLSAADIKFKPGDKVVIEGTFDMYWAGKAAYVRLPGAFHSAHVDVSAIRPAPVPEPDMEHEWVFASSQRVLCGTALVNYHRYGVEVVRDLRCKCGLVATFAGDDYLNQKCPNDRDTLPCGHGCERGC